MSKNESANAEMHETDSTSICTLCLLEINGNAFENFSSSLSPCIQATSSFNNNATNFATLQETRLNFIEENMTAGNDCLQCDRTTFDNIKNMELNDNEAFDWKTSQPEENNDCKSKTINCPDEDINLVAISKSGENILKCSEITFEDKKLLSKLSSQNDDQETQLVREQSAVFSFAGLSQTMSIGIGILPKISQAIIDQVLNDMDNDLIQGQKNISGLSTFDKPFNEPQQLSMLKTSTQTMCNVINNDKLVSTVNSSLEPIQHFQVRITNDENRLKKVQFYNAQDIKNVPSKETLKRDKNNDPIEAVTGIPKKKPKIITQEVLKMPVQHMLLSHKRPAIDDSKENIKNNVCTFNTKDFQGQMKRLRIPNETTKSDRRIGEITNKGVDKSKKNDVENEICLSADRSRGKIRKVEEETSKTEKSLQNPSKSPRAPVKKFFPHKGLSLSMLQRKIAENSKRLINQAEEMNRFSSFIDELRESFASAEIEIAEVSRTKREKVKTEFVSRSTQTADPPIIIDVDGSTIKIPSIGKVQEPNGKSSETKNNSSSNIETETDTFVRNWFRPNILKNNQDMVRESVSNVRQMIPKILSSAPEKVDVQLSVNKMLPKTVENEQKSNSLLQYDPYYNPLRPRRWPRNRNNRLKFGPKSQSKGKQTFFPPLPIVIENGKSKNVPK